MLSKAFEKYVNSLKTKKGRREHGAYVMEGEKSVLELLSSNQRWQHIVVTEERLPDYSGIINASDKRVIVCSGIQMSKLSSLQTPSPLLAVTSIPVYDSLPALRGLALVLDGIRDPGNLGTIIRSSDWFNVDCIFASGDTVDAYNPKTVQAAMGSILRVPVIERSLESVFDHYSNARVYAADMSGEPLHNVVFTEPALLVIGNEGSGIGEHHGPVIHQRITIPKFGKAESLNASVAASIVCAWWRLNAGSPK